MSSQDRISYSAIPKSMVAQSAEPKSSTSERPARWHISLRAPITMLALFLSGIAVSIGHHVLYSHLHGTAVRSAEEGSDYLTQIWIIRYGTAFAFLAKALLVSAVVAAYKQYIWINLRARANSISTIDAMFAATYDIFAAMSLNLLLGAKLPAVMALITWLLPLAALITPSTLVVVPSTRDDVVMMHVPTLNFNSSKPYLSTFGFGDGTSPSLTRLTSAVASSMEILPMRAIAPNTTYRHEFWGPSLSCTNATGDILNNLTVIWNETQNAISGDAGGDLIYLAYTRPEGDFGAALQNATIFVSTCVTSDIYSGMTPGPNSDDTCSVRRASHAITMRMGNESLVCSERDTHFEVLFEATGDVQTMNSVRFTRLDTLSTVTSEEQRTSYQATTQALVTLLNGAIGNTRSKVYSQTSDTIATRMRTIRTRIMNTALMGPLSTALPSAVADDELSANKTLAMMVEELSRNQTLSLFSSERLWLPQNATNMTPVTQTSFYTIYEYRSRNLIMTYSIAIAFSAFGVILGLWALWVNGICHETSFSSIMTTTRNTYLDEMTLGYSLGSAPTPDAVKKLKLRFGELRNGSVEHRTRAAFGLEGETVPLRKGQVIH